MMTFNDSTPMPFGKYVGVKLANVPGPYLLWLLENNKAHGALKTYILENLEILKKEK